MTTLNSPIPLLDLQAQYATIRPEIDEAMARVVESQVFIMGPEVAALEQEIAAYSCCAHGIGVSSGTDALLVALMALGIGPGDEVITTPYTFFATAGCIARLGARPVFVDIDPITFNLDPSKIEAAITRQTRAILPVHLYGQMADMDPIMALASAYDLYVIEDAAQAIGAEYKGRRAGSIGHLGCFSFFPSKNLGAFGDGGMVVTNDAVLAERVDVLRRHGAQPKYYHRFVGGNFRLDALQAAVLRVKLRHLEAWTDARRQNSGRYRRLFSKAGLVSDAVGRNRDDAPIALPLELADRRHVYNQFVIRCAERDDLMQFMKTAGIGCEIYYPLSLHEQECFLPLSYAAGDFPMSESAAQTTLALPIFAELTEAMQSAVVDTIAKFYYPASSGKSL